MVLGLIGLIFGFIAMVVVVTSLPRTALVDWTTRTVELRTLTKRRQIAFEAIQAVEMKALHHLSTGKTRRHYYWCEVGLHVRSDTTGEVGYEALVATERIRTTPTRRPEWRCRSRRSSRGPARSPMFA